MTTHRPRTNSTTIKPTTIPITRTTEPATKPTNKPTTRPTPKPTKPPGWCDKNSNCKRDEVCLNHRCQKACLHKKCTKAHEVCRVPLLLPHMAKCQCESGWVRKWTGRCGRPNPGWCLPHQHCKAGDCCALGTSCNTCPYGYITNNQECAGKGNFQCKWSW